ncbi:hypothetical protein AR687_20275 [Flavobacteriaceae bacterium CRH]|nr:hypothetical protein AR687_20275 [Flavobacteriaceae bacterium CRH]
MLDKIIPYTTVEGFQYLIKFTQFSKKHLPETFTLPIVDITIEAMESPRQTNNGKTLFHFSSTIQKFIDENNIVLYFYCSNDPITKNKKRQDISDAQFRSNLFCKMFEKQNLDNNFICENIIIRDPNNGDHHIHLISRLENETEIKIIINDGLPYFENK